MKDEEFLRKNSSVITFRELVKKVKELIRRQKLIISLLKEMKKDEME